jgi:DNA-binding MarR family transcriptional regulator
VPASDAFDAELAAAWPRLMELVLEQRWRWAEVADELGISQAGLRGLLAINPDEPRPMGDLAREMNCDRSYVTGIVDDLERAGYAERRTAAHDRRVKAIALTEQGRRALDTVRDTLLAPPSGLATLTAAQQRTIARLLTKALSAPGPSLSG